MELRANLLLEIMELEARIADLWSLEVERMLQPGQLKWPPMLLAQPTMAFLAHYGGEYGVLAMRVLLLRRVTRARKCSEAELLRRYLEFS
jgi:hypothetical protein